MTLPMTNTRSRDWQSRVALLLVLPAAVAYALIQCVDVPALRLVVAGAVFSLGLAAVVLAARAATRGAAAVGALLTFCYAVTPSYPHSPLWVLSAMLFLTLGASRIGRARKTQQGTAEAHGSRSAAQVAANIGVGALAGSFLSSHGSVLAHTAMLAALGEATADTLASEIGQLAKGSPRLLLSGRRVPAGTDGAVSLLGTLTGVAGAIVLCAVAWWAFALPVQAVCLGAVGAIFGFLLDSALGQLLELRGWLNNDAVNFLSTAAAAILTLALGSYVP